MLTNEYKCTIMRITFDGKENFMNAMTDENQDLMKREARYVHDMMELERRAYLLRQTATQTQEELKRNIRQAETEYQAAQMKREEAYGLYHEIKAGKENQKLFEYFKAFYKTGVGKGIGFVIPLFIFGWFLFIILERFIGSLFNSSQIFFSKTSFFIMILTLLSWSLLVALIALIFALCRFWDRRSLHKAERFCKKADGELREAEIKYEEANEYIKNLRECAKILNHSVHEIETLLDKNYEWNDIPCDCRCLEYLIRMDYAFRHDLVCTLREAVQECDRLEGPEDRKIPTLAEEIGRFWEEINADIAEMDWKILRVAKSGVANFSKSDCMRYARESVKKCLETLAAYKDMKHDGENECK